MYKPFLLLRRYSFILTRMSKACAETLPGNQLLLLQRLSVKLLQRLSVKLLQRTFGSFSYPLESVLFQFTNGFGGTNCVQ
jgi:hypothetical protein